MNFLYFLHLLGPEFHQKCTRRHFIFERISDCSFEYVGFVFDIPAAARFHVDDLLDSAAAAHCVRRSETIVRAHRRVQR